MFDRIAWRYDLMNCLMTLGQDRIWRRHVVRDARLPYHGRLLDAATGTGRIALEALQHPQKPTVLGVDFSLGMMRVGREQFRETPMWWAAADALHLPFADCSFDAVVSGFLMRNVADVRGAFREQVRVVRPGGRIVCLETSPPSGPLRPAILLYLRGLIPLLGWLIAGDRSAYTYLPESTQQFATPGELAAIMSEVGLQDVAVRRLMIGTIAIHSGTRP
jgi:demethylmenaquinone methyltransferase/2-methoxy-6-polyprenyl-1,4-benzoquinol methylase